MKSLILRWCVVMLAVSSCLSLVGCGEDNGEADMAISPPVSKVSKDIISIIQPGELKRIPLYQTFKVNPGDELVVESVTTLNSASKHHCAQVGINGLELAYRSEELGVCVYEYVIRNGNIFNKSKLISLVSTSESPRLADINFEMQIDTSMTIDIEVGEEEHLDVITVLGSGLAKAENHQIVYQSTNLGISRVVYSITKVNGELQIGVINFTVSTAAGGNRPPVMPEVTASTLPGKSIVIRPAITDPDVGDDPQLISVANLQGAAVSPAIDDSVINEAYFTNKAFTFSATAPGLYTVYYTAHDHNGGYSTGRATVVVEGEVGLSVRNATFFRQVTDKAYDFKIDLRSFITSSDMSQIEIVSSNFSESSVDKAPDNLIKPTTENPVMTYRYPGGGLRGTVVVDYTVADPTGLVNAKIFISIGEELPEITSLTTDPIVEEGVTVKALSECINCEPSETRYDWYFGSALYSREAHITVPQGERGEILILVATPYDESGKSGKPKIKEYIFPLKTLTASISEEEAYCIVTINSNLQGHPDDDSLIEIDNEADHWEDMTNAEGNVVLKLNCETAKEVMINAEDVSIPSIMIQI